MHSLKHRRARRFRARSGPIRGRRHRIRQVAGAAACSLVALAAAATAAATPLALPTGSRLVFGFDVVGCAASRPLSWESRDDHRIFVNREAKRARLQLENGEDEWAVVDGNATSDLEAILAAGPPAIYDVYVRMLDEPGRDFRVCEDAQTDLLRGERLCRLGTVDLTRSDRRNLQLAPSWLFGREAKGLLWTADRATGTRVAQLLVYSPPEPIAH